MLILLLNQDLRSIRKGSGLRTVRSVWCVRKPPGSRLSVRLCPKDYGWLFPIRSRATPMWPYTGVSSGGEDHDAVVGGVQGCARSEGRAAEVDRNAAVAGAGLCAPAGLEPSALRPMGSSARMATSGTAPSVWRSHSEGLLLRSDICRPVDPAEELCVRSSRYAQPRTPNSRASRRAHVGLARCGARGSVSLMLIRWISRPARDDGSWNVADHLGCSGADACGGGAASPAASDLPVHRAVHRRAPDRRSAVLHHGSPVPGSAARAVPLGRRSARRGAARRDQRFGRRPRRRRQRRQRSGRHRPRHPDPARCRPDGHPDARHGRSRGHGASWPTRAAPASGC